MSTITLGILIFIIIMGIGFFILAIGIYNSLVALEANTKKAWANIDVILKQRYDQIPQLLSICEQYVKYEKEMIDRIMSAREKMVSGKSITEKADGLNEVNSALGGLLALGENYPELKANESFNNIQEAISSLEERIADRREFYNDSVNIYNIRIKQIPDVFFARILGYFDKELFEVQEIEKQIPNLKMKL